jgi:hypothetical protein
LVEALSLVIRIAVPLLLSLSAASVAPASVSLLLCAEVAPALTVWRSVISRVCGRGKH